MSLRIHVSKTKVDGSLEIAKCGNWFISEGFLGNSLSQMSTTTIFGDLEICKGHMHPFTSIEHKQ